MGIFLGVSGLFALFFTQTIHSAPLPEGRLVPAPEAEIIEQCLKVQKPKHVWTFFEKNLQWKRTCTDSEWKDAIESSHKDLAPHEALLVAYVHYEEYLKFRSEFELTLQNKERFEREDSFFFLPEPDEKASEMAVSKLSKIRNATVPWHDQFELLLRPLFKSKLDRKKYGRSKSQLFSREAGQLWIEFLASSGRYVALNEALETEVDFLLRSRRDRNKVLAVLQDMAKVDVEALKLFRPMFIKYFEKIRDRRVSSLKEQDFEAWLYLLELKGRPTSGLERQALLEDLRRLWILFPTKEHKVRIRKTAIVLGVSRNFIGPSPRQMKLDEMLTHSKQQNRFLEGAKGLVTMSHVLKLPTKLIDREELWKALQWHVRLLRIMDERPKIANILNRYLKKGRFIDVPKKSADREKFFERLYRVARWRWSYDSIDIAIKNLDQIIALNRAWNTDYELASAYYVRARIAEQSGDKVAARPYFDQAIQELQKNKKWNNDLYRDLLWRRFYNSLDLGHIRGSYQSLVEELEVMKSELDWEEEEGRWLFWVASAHLLEGRKDEAEDFFEKAYEHEPLSYYSTMAGVELIKLGEKPSGWELDAANEYWADEKTEWSVPSFKEVFSTTTLKVKRRQDRAWARIYGLASIGFFENARRYLSSLERRAYVYAMSSKRRYGTRKKRRYLRKIAWLRLAVGDNIGALRMGELARITFKGKIYAPELAVLYPLPFQKIIEEKSEKVSLDPWHAISLIRQESAFNPPAPSIANALGLMQVIPPVAQKEADELKIQNFQPDQLSDPNLAIRIGTYHLSKLVRDYDSSKIVSTAGYNAGRMPLAGWLSHYSHPYPYAFVDRISFAETRGYVRSILRNYVNYSRIYNQAQFDPERLLIMPSPAKIASRLR